MIHYTPETVIGIDPTAWALGVAALARYEQGDRVGTLKEHMCAVLVLQAQADFLVRLAGLHATGNVPQDAVTEGWVWDEICAGSTGSKVCMLGGEQAAADIVGFGSMYAATTTVIQDMVNGAVAHPPLPKATLPPGGVEGLGALPVAAYATITLLGAAAMAASAWWAVEREEKAATISVEATRQAVQLARYQAWLDDNYARGGPPPKPPEWVDSLAAEQKAGSWATLGAGVVLGGLAVVGVAHALKTPRAQRAIARVANPRRRARRARVRPRMLAVAKRRKRRRNPPPGVRAVGVKEHSRKRPPRRKKRAKKKAPTALPVKRVRAPKKRAAKKQPTRTPAAEAERSRFLAASKRKKNPAKKRAPKKRAPKKRAKRSASKKKAKKKAPRRENPARRWVAHLADLRTLNTEIKLTQWGRDEELRKRSAVCKRMARDVKDRCAEQRAVIRAAARREVENLKGEKAQRRADYRSGRITKRMRSESDSLAEHNVPPELVWLWREEKERFSYDAEPDDRAVAFLEWVEADAGNVAARAAARVWSDTEMALLEAEARRRGGGYAAAAGVPF
jgi:hypothetical protein